MSGYFERVDAFGYDPIVVRVEAGMGDIELGLAEPTLLTSGESKALRKALKRAERAVEENARA